MKTLLFLLIGLLIVLQYRLWFANDGLLQMYRTEKELSLQKQKNNDLTKHNQGLTHEIDALKEGGSAIESRARNDLGMVKKGEVFYQVVK